MRAIHGTRGRTFKVYAFTVISTAVTRTFEFICRRLPFRRTAQMRAPRKNHKNTIRLTNNPHAVGHQIPLVDAQRKIRGIADVEYGVRFVERARKEKSEEHQKI